ncbi:MAG: hypothetical protein M3Y44_10260 [Actinomycetota bacterium]|nr:hypothetical protein [Actinomycetota bacterium]
MTLKLDKRFWVGGGAVAAVLLVVAGWFGAISPQLSGASSLRNQSDSVQQANGVLQSKIAALKQQNSTLHTLTAKLQAALDALPFDSGLPAFTRQVSSQAAQHRVALTSISVGTAGPAAAAPAVPAAAVPAAAGPAAGATPVAALYSMPITLRSTGSAKDQLAFLQAIRLDGPRRALINSTDLSPGAGAASPSIDKSSTMITQLTIYSAPMTPQALAQLQKLLRGDLSGS